MTERRIEESSMAEDGIPLRVHFERVLREETTRLNESTIAIRGELATALAHHREMHDRDHTWGDRLQEVFQQTVARTVESHAAKFDAFEREYRDKLTDLRERSDGRDTRLRDDFSRELRAMRETAQLEINNLRENTLREISRLGDTLETEIKEMKHEVIANGNEITGIKSRYQAYAVALTIFLTIITIGINLLAVILGPGG